MSFGFSVGDFFAVGQLAWNLYKSCKEAGGAFVELSHEVSALHIAIKELQDEIENPDSILNRTGAGKKSELGLLVKNCNGVLQQLKKKLIKYKSLGSASKRTWDRLRWGAENLQEIREKLLAHTSSLTLFLTTLGTGSLGRIEKKLDQLIQDVRAGRREGTVLTFAIGEDDPDESEIQWDLLKGELIEDGFAKSELEGHKHWIKAKLTELLENGGLDEEEVPERSGTSKAKHESPRPPVYTEKEIEASGISKAPPEERRKSPKTVEAKNAAAFQPTVEDANEEDEPNEPVPRVFDKREPPESPASNNHVPEEDALEDDDHSEEESSSGSKKSDEKEPPKEPVNPPKKSASYEYKRPLRTSQERSRKGDMQRREEDEERARQKLEKEIRAAHGEKKKSRDKERRRDAEEKQPRRAAYVEDDSSDDTEDTFLATAVLPADSFSQVGLSPPPSEPRDGSPEGAKFSATAWPQTFKPQTFVPPPPDNPTQRSHIRKAANNSDILDEALPPRSRKLPPTQNGYYPNLPARPFSSPPRRANQPEPTRYVIDNAQIFPMGPYRTQNMQDLDDEFDHTIPDLNNEERLNQKSRLYGDPYGDYDADDNRYYYRSDSPSPIIKHARPMNASRKSVPPPISKAKTFHNDVPRLPRASTFQNRYSTDPESSRSKNQGQRFNIDPLSQGGRGSNFDTSNQEGDGFQFSNPDNIFSDFLRGQTSQNEATSPGYKPPRSETLPVTTVERPLALTLEELFKGTHKKMKIKRKFFDEVTGRRTTQDKVLEMDIKPGLKKGSKIKFKGVGDQEEAGLQDLHFIIEEKEHALFTRDGDNLSVTLELSLIDSLCGFKRTVTTIDGKMIAIERLGTTDPESIDTYPGLGMPSKKPDQRGVFIVKYKIRYPKTMTKYKQNQLRTLLQGNNNDYA